MTFRIILSALAVLILSGCDPITKKSQGIAALAAVEDAITLPEKVSFNEHIQPILSEYCYHCHGPDSGTRAPKNNPLRLDTEKDAFALRSDGRPVIIKGKPEESRLYQLMASPDPDMVMPPPESHKTMKKGEVALIKRWIEQGAGYEVHWSFNPVRKPDVPAAGAAWAANPIDRFIAEKLDEQGLSPNPPDDLRRFHRRLALDLTGLPPAPEAVDAFLKSAATDPQGAVGAEADRLLATTASAEHFARHWLDAARYADTHGIHIDNYRAIWPYRDWVIRAFQENMPWDRFTTEQIAGDMLPNRTLDQQVASGFGRCLATTGEGGAIGEEYDAIYAKDRVDTMSAIWLGLTAGCASCHDHKFDPVSTREFYSLTAFFRNTPMSSLDGNNAEHPPNVFVPLLEDRARWDVLANETSGVEKQLAERQAGAGPEFEAWLANATIKPASEIDSTLSIHLPLAESEGAIHGIVDGKPREWPATVARIDAPIGKAPVISETSIELGDLGGFSRGDRVTFGAFIRVEGTPTGAIVARMNPAESHRGWDFFLENGRPACHIIDTWDKAANKLVAPGPLTPGEWHHVMVTFDGTAAGHQASAIFVDGKRVNAEAGPNTVGGAIETAVPLRLGSRENGDSKLSGKVAIQDFRFYRRLLSAAEISSIGQNSLLHHISSLPAAERTKEQVEVLFKYYVANIDQTSRELRVKLDAIKTEQAAIRSRGSVCLVMEEKKDPPFAHILERGVYSAKGERVTPDTPAILPPMTADMPRNRLGLAHWLNDPANPLPARVTMNRTWHYFFGNGIVESTGDFGIMGARPSHPKLLDWLAAEFVEAKWNYRHMIKLMVTSSAYRQSGALSSGKLEKDPSNRLVARGPRNRLDAEQIRDLALESSGLLSTKVGGPPVKPYQPEGIWEAVAMPQSNTRDYRQDSGESLYRRSLYSFWKRTAAPPSMEILNAPSRETFCVRRERTNTPLQALVLLNDPQFVETSRELAAAAMKSAADFNPRLDFITLRLDSRIFADDEKEVVRKSFDALAAGFHANREEAVKLVTTGAKPPPADLDAAELAAWTLVSSQILNLDETLTR
jgi:Protein of unknown function (DUF1553)/Protein of unknown function (DUF1549)/Concanavalin A-like lectin/glucanases superfamily/Planctomycete cytochrome C